MTENILGKNLQAIIDSHSWYQYEMIDFINQKSGTNIMNRSNLKNWIDGIRYPREEAMKAICSALKIAPDLMVDHVFNNEELDLIKEGRGYELRTLQHAASYTVGSFQFIPVYEAGNVIGAFPTTLSGGHIACLIRGKGFPDKHLPKGSLAITKLKTTAKAGDLIIRNDYSPYHVIHINDDIWKVEDTNNNILQVDRTSCIGVIEHIYI